MGTEDNGSLPALPTVSEEAKYMGLQDLFTTSPKQMERRGSSQLCPFREVGMGSKPKLVADCFSLLPPAANWELWPQL